MSQRICLRGERLRMQCHPYSSNGCRNSGLREPKTTLGNITAKKMKTLNKPYTNPSGQRGIESQNLHSEEKLDLKSN